jgi:YD repeat-containing protein
MDSYEDGRLAKVHTINPGMATISYPYDSLGRLAGRIVKDSNDNVIASATFVWDGNHIAQELDTLGGDGTLSAALTFVSDDAGFQHCISTRNGTTYYPVKSSATPVALSSDTGAVLERYDHDEAGELLLSDGTAKTTAIGPVRWMAPESLRDPATGFILGHGCVYSPLLGAVTHKEKPKPKPTSSSSSHELKGHVTLIK